MGDLFDEFMRELERRRAEADRGKRPGDRSGGDEPDGDGSDDDEGAEPPADDATTGEHDDATKEEHDGTPEDEPAAAGEDQPEEEPVPFRRSRRRTRGGSRRRPPRTPVGGPDDGADRPSFRDLIRRAGLIAIVIVVILVVLLAGAGIDLWTDAIWYSSVGFDAVFWTRIGAQAWLFVGGLVVALVLLLGNLALAGRLTPPPDPSRPGRLRTVADRIAQAQRQAEWNARMRSRGGGFGPFGGQSAGRPAGVEFSFGGEDMPDMVPIGGLIIAGFAVLLSLGIAGAISGAWTTILLWMHRVPFSATSSVVDPIFGKDISFFLFELPFFRLVQEVANGILLALLLLVGARYLLAVTRGGEVFVTRVRVHLAIIAGLYLLSVAIGYQLDKYELVYDQSTVATGVLYTDAHARFFAYDVLTVLSGLAAALLVAGAFTRWMWPLGLIVGVWFVASILLGRLYPEAIQRFTVDPNTYAQEQPYIANNIAMTRLAFGLNEWSTQNYSGESPLTAAAVTNEADTFTNARLWDYRPLQKTLDQLQTVRQYYDFYDVDTDRYVVDGHLRQVMLSARELAIEKNPDATSWVNERIIYTHGIGVAMVPVNEVTTEGQPELWIRNLPPVSNPGLPEVTQPRIYFGERDDHYVVVRARQAEFDYPRDTSAGNTDATTSWTANTGIPLDTTLSRLLFALRFRDLDLLITDQITSDSQLLFHRTLSDRLGMIAPFLRFDKDPYVYIDSRGHLVYVQDAYTVSDRFPHATTFDTTLLGGGSGLSPDPINYIRNSVKITIDAYDGTMHFYVNDEQDPLIRAWQGVFPTLFEPRSAMPADLVAHLRVPEELFNVQTRMYGQFHVQDTLTFFNNTDRWTVPAAQTNQQVLPSEAYYVVMRMPGEPSAEFLLLQPMIARERPNMIAWVAARNDQPNYGAVRVYQFPSDTTIFGPAQIEARIDQDPTISAQITLWNQSGSDVVRGNLIVVPVGDSLLYLQPVYLQSTSSAFPEFQRIVVASPTTVTWARTLRDALTQLLQAQGQAPSPSPGTSPPPTATPGPSATPRPTLPPGSGLPTDVPGLIDYANTHFELAQQALRNGDFATYGSEMNLVQAALQALGQLTATPGASAQP